jgi:hypothetical protein
LNTGDRGQVERGQRQENLDRIQYLADIRAVLQTPSGRRMLWQVLVNCRVFASVWDPSARIHFNEGRRNVGLELMGDLAAADEDAFMQMQNDAHLAMKQKRLEHQQNERQHTKSSPEYPDADS